MSCPIIQIAFQGDTIKNPPDDECQRTEFCSSFFPSHPDELPQVAGAQELKEPGAAKGEEG